MRRHTTFPNMAFDLDKICAKANNNGLWCMRGEPNIFEYMANDKNVLIATSKGFLVVPHDALDQFISELEYIRKNVEGIKEFFKGGKNDN